MVFHPHSVECCTLLSAAKPNKQLWVGGEEVVILLLLWPLWRIFPMDESQMANSGNAKQ